MRVDQRTVRRTELKPASFISLEVLVLDYEAPFVVQFHFPVEGVADIDAPADQLVDLKRVIQIYICSGT